MDEKRSHHDDLVPERECGTCTVCCKSLKIDAPEIKKLADVLCPHCTHAVGCKIYETRPQVCEGWYCGWRRMPHLDDEWRPDRCGVLICLVGAGEGIPSEFPQFGLKFDTVSSPDVLNWDPLLKYIGFEIARGTPVFLGTQAPIGYERRKVFLNYLMAHAVASRQRMLMVDALQRAYAIGLADAMKEKTKFG
jgi:hypothetical protein